MKSEVSARVDLAQIAIPGVELTYTGLRITDPDLPFEAFENLLIGAGKFATSAKWWIGDALNLGEFIYGEMYAQAMDETGLSYQTLANYRYVCERVQSYRRKESLRFSHHAAVASLPAEVQTEWLDAAVENGWSVAELRGRIQEASPQPKPEQPQWSKKLPQVKVLVHKQDGETVEVPAVVEEYENKSLTIALVPGGEQSVSAVFAPAVAQAATLALLPPETSGMLVTAVLRLLALAGEQSPPGWLVEPLADLAGLVNYEAKEE